MDTFMPMRFADSKAATEGSNAEREFYISDSHRRIFFPDPSPL